MNKIIDLSKHRKSPPNTINGKVIPPRRLKNKERRSREHLEEHEVEDLIASAGRQGRHKHRDKTMLLIAYRHGLRVSELVSLRWEQVDLKKGLIHINRLKNGTDSTHPLRGPELRALRKLERDYPDTPYLFISERGGPVSTATVRKMITRAGEKSKIPFPVHPHMLRHSTGYKLANDQQDTRAIQHYLGHKNIQHTVRYTELDKKRFNSFWKD